MVLHVLVAREALAAGGAAVFVVAGVRALVLHHVGSSAEGLVTVLALVDLHPCTQRGRRESSVRDPASQRRPSGTPAPEGAHDSFASSSKQMFPDKSSTQPPPPLRSPILFSLLIKTTKNPTV